MAQYTLVVNSISKSYKKIQALSELNLGLFAGEIVGLLGPNGAGKSTLIKLIGGLIMPDSGDISICGVGLYNDYERCMRMTGVVPDRPRFFNYLTGYENLRIIADYYPGVGKDRIEELSALLDLGDYLDYKVSDYPTGIVQLLAIAGAMLNEPALLVLDEAFEGVDPLSIVTVRRCLRQLAAESGVTTLLSSHQMGELDRVCDRIAILSEGRLEGIGSVEELKLANGGATRHKLFSDRPGEAARFIAEVLKIRVELRGEALILQLDPQGVPAVISSLVSKGFKIYSVEPLERTLEEAYYRMLKNSLPAESIGFAKPGALY